MGAATKLINAPINCVAMAVLGRPDERIKWFKPTLMENKKYPGNTICAYSRANGSTSPSAPQKASNWFKNK